MLEDIREKKTNYLNYILVAAAGIGMLFIGVPFFNRQSSDPVVATVNGKDVTLQQYNQTYREIQNNNPDMPAEKIKQQALQQIIQAALFQQQALNNGYTLSNQALYDIIKNQFGDNKNYQTWLNSRNLTATAYQNIVRREESIKNYYNIVHPELTQDNPLFTSFLAAIAQKRSYTLYTLALSPVAQNIQATDKEIKQYYQDNQKHYLTPEKASIKYIIFDADSLPVPKDLDKEAIAKAKAAAEKRSGEYLIFDDEKVAATADAALKDGSKTFSDYRQAIKEKKISGDSGDLPPNVKGLGVSPEIDNALFALKKPGDISPLIHSQYGNIIITLSKIDDGGKTEAQWLKEAAAKENENLYTKLANQAYDAAQNNQPLSAIADITGTHIQTLQNITADNLTQPWLNNPEVKSQLFGDKAIAVNHTAVPAELAAHKSLFFVVTERQKAQPEPLDTIREQVLQDYRNTQAGKTLDKNGNALLKALQDTPEKAATLAGEYHADIRKVTAASRFEAKNAVIAQLFNKAKPVSMIHADNGDLIIAKLDSVQPGDIHSIPESQQQLLFSIWKKQSIKDTDDGMAQWLYNHAKIKIYPDVIQKI